MARACPVHNKDYVGRRLDTKYRGQTQRFQDALAIMRLSFAIQDEFHSGREDALDLTFIMGSVDNSSLNPQPVTWFKDFLGVGYRYHDVYMNVFPLFEDKMFAHRLWKNTVEWWPDDEIKLRFVEDGSEYWFILYGGSRYKNDNTGFVKKVPVSENYERFKVGFEKKAILRFGIYKEKLKKKEDSSNYDLEILKKSKSVYDIAFLQNSELPLGSVESQCIQEYGRDGQKI